MPVLGGESMSEEFYTGEVVWFHIERGYGFVSWKKDGKDQKDMFAHYSDIEMNGFKQLRSGQKVQFKVGTNNSGNPKATEIKVIE